MGTQSLAPEHFFASLFSFTFCKGNFVQPQIQTWISLEADEKKICNKETKTTETSLGDTQTE